MRPRFREQHIWLKDKAAHDTWWSNELDLAIDTPAEFAGLRLRFSMPVEGPVSYHGLKGKKVRMTLPKIWLSRLTVELPIAAVNLAEEPDSPSAQTPQAK